MWSGAAYFQIADRGAVVTGEVPLADVLDGQLNFLRAQVDVSALGCQLGRAPFANTFPVVRRVHLDRLWAQFLDHLLSAGDNLFLLLGRLTEFIKL